MCVWYMCVLQVTPPKYYPDSEYPDSYGSSGYHPKDISFTLKEDGAVRYPNMQPTPVPGPPFTTSRMYVQQRQETLCCPSILISGRLLCSWLCL